RRRQLRRHDGLRVPSGEASRRQRRRRQQQQKPRVLAGVPVRRAGAGGGRGTGHHPPRAPRAARRIVARRPRGVRLPRRGGRPRQRVVRVRRAARLLRLRRLARRDARAEAGLPRRRRRHGGTYKAVTRAANFRRQPKKSRKKINEWVSKATNKLIASPPWCS
ncbi:hypothetical protein EE612_054376, partial [Oryza sativa]